MMRHFIAIMTLLVAATCCLSAKNRVEISKQQLHLWVINEKGDTIFDAPVCVGKNYGNKQKVGDMRTPEGTFAICQIQDASAWTHDFKDGYGVRKGAYGPYFFRLKVPGNNSIGIHGTCFPERIGTRDSEGCIRLNNDDLRRLRKHIEVGTMVTVQPDAKDIK